MLVSVPLYLDDLPGRPTGADLREALSAFYEGSEHVTVAPGSRADKLEPEALNGTNRLDLYVCANEARRHAVLIAQLDNLGKGASGAAVQNLRLMLDLDSKSRPVCVS
jgi:N-acetyl-gamma-glutamyl-phosphate reductase